MSDNFSRATGIDPRSDDGPSGSDASASNNDLGTTGSHLPYNGILFVVGNRVSFEQFEDLKTSFSDQMERHGIKLSGITFHGSSQNVEVREITPKDRRLLVIANALIVLGMVLTILAMTLELFGMYR